MSKKQIDQTAGRVGAMMRRARRMCGLSTDDLATMLRIMPDELAAYEHAHKEIPMSILEHMFVMSYKMIQVRIIEYRYNRQRNFLRSKKQPVTSVAE